MNTTDITLAEFFASNLTQGGMIQRKLRVTTLAELMMHTPRMILHASGLGTPSANFVTAQATEHQLKQRKSDPLEENVLDYLARAYGSLDNSPVSVLNFMVSAQNVVFFRPLVIVTQLAADNPRLTIEDLKSSDEEIQVSGPSPLLQDMQDFGRRLHDWGFQRRD
ncbi:MAG: hypothetical protein WAO28_00090 [Candidatus Microsaccharimonas sp.]